MKGVISPSFQVASPPPPLPLFSLSDMQLGGISPLPIGSCTTLHVSICTVLIDQLCQLPSDQFPTSIFILSLTQLLHHFYSSSPKSHLQESIPFSSRLDSPMDVTSLLMRQFSNGERVEVQSTTKSQCYKVTMQNIM